MAEILTKSEEIRLRELARGIITGIEEPEDVLKRLEFTLDEYTALTETRMFRLMLTQAQSEWDGASNTHKRIKLKAAVNIEEALPHFYKAMVNPNEPLSSKVKAFEAISKVAGLGQPEPVAAGNGQFFNLQINLGAGVTPLSFGANPNAALKETIVEAIRGTDYAIATAEEVQALIKEAQGLGTQESIPVYTQSKLLEDVPFEEL